MHLHHIGESIGAFQEFFDVFRYHLPTQPVFILAPAALLGVRNTREFFPKVINFFLVLAGDRKGHGFVEFKIRTSIDSHKTVAAEFVFYS